MMSPLQSWLNCKKDKFIKDYIIGIWKKASIELHIYKQIACNKILYFYKSLIFKLIWI